MRWDEDDLDVALRDLRDEEVPGYALAQVKARVLAEVRPVRSRWRRWAWVPVVAVALAIVAVIPREQAPVEQPPLIARAPAAQPLGRPAARVVRRTRPAPPRLEETQFARIMTDDPNVVILWAMNTEGDSQ